MNKMSIDELLDSAINTFQHWINIHTDPEHWANVWNIDDNWQYVLENCPTIGNGYFSFDIKSACLKLWAEENEHLFCQCQSCGLIQEWGFEDDECCDNPEYEDLDDTEYLIEWLNVGSIENYLIPDYLVQRVMETEGFKVYTEAVRPVFESSLDEIQECLDAMQSDDNQERLAGLAWANHVYHVNGGVLSDYGDRFDYPYSLVNEISQKGLESVFDIEEIQEFLIA